jgi:hypothetical protein
MTRCPVFHSWYLLCAAPGDLKLRIAMQGGTRDSVAASGNKYERTSGVCVDMNVDSYSKQ